jgi:acyl carrier protein
MTLREEILEKVIAISAEHFMLPKEVFNENTHYLNDIGADSLDAAELILMLEQEYKMNRVSDEDFIHFVNIKSIVDYIENKLNQNDQINVKNNEESFEKISEYLNKNEEKKCPPEELLSQDSEL